MSQKFQFLSPEWEKAAEELGQGVQAEAPEDLDMTVNVTVSPTPFGDKNLSIFNHQGQVSVEKSHRENADVSVKTDYETAYKLFMGSDMNLILSAMLEGKLLVQGDIAKLMNSAQQNGAIQALPMSEELTKELIEITEPLEIG